MIRKVNYSNYFILGFLLFVTVSCATSKQTLTTKRYYKTIACNGEHARALTIIDGLVITGGKNGYFSVHSLDTNLMPDPFIEQIPDMEDFRDVHVNESGISYFLNSGTDGKIFVVIRSGQRQEVLNVEGVFLDGLDFWDYAEGIVFGDPVNDQFYLASTVDMGRTWQMVAKSNLPKSLPNEAAFAASGTAIQTVGDSTVYFGTGGADVVRLFCSHDRGQKWVAKETPMKGGDSYGIYSVFFWAENEGVIIGGSYKDSTYNKDICHYTDDSGDTWQSRSKGLLGYCSCVHGTPDGSLLVATGRVGTFYSLDKGKSWKILTKSPYYSCRVSGTHIALLGRDGALEVLEYTVHSK